MPLDYYSTGVLKEAVHHRLVADIQHIAATAGIVPQWIAKPLGETAGPAVVDWVRKFPKNRAEGLAGLCLAYGDLNNSDIQCSAIAGALLRNFIDARVISMATLLDTLEDKSREAPDPTCLIIPNFFVGKTNGVTFPTWKLSLLQDLLMERRRLQRPTVVYVADFNGLEAEYGAAFADLIRYHYTQAQI